MTVYDPSFGHATGGGWFYWPDTADPATVHAGDRTDFGFTMRSNRNGANLRGYLLMIWHLADGTIYRVKSNTLDGLALGEDPTVPMGWAVFSGKAIYQDPAMPEPVGNRGFQAYVEDRDEPGTGVDRFWIQVTDKDDEVIASTNHPCCMASGLCCDSILRRPARYSIRASSGSGSGSSSTTTRSPRPVVASSMVRRGASIAAWPPSLR